MYYLYNKKRVMYWVYCQFIIFIWRKRVTIKKDSDYILYIKKDCNCIYLCIKRNLLGMQSFSCIIYLFRIENRLCFNKCRNEILNTTNSLTLDPNNASDFLGYPYAIGLDPVWLMSYFIRKWCNDNEITILFDNFLLI